MGVRTREPTPAPARVDVHHACSCGCTRCRRARALSRIRVLRRFARIFASPPAPGGAGPAFHSPERPRRAPDPAPPDAPPGRPGARPALRARASLFLTRRTGSLSPSLRTRVSHWLWGYKRTAMTRRRLATTQATRSSSTRSPVAAAFMGAHIACGGTRHSTVYGHSSQSRASCEMCGRPTNGSHTSIRP